MSNKKNRKFENSPENELLQLELDGAKREINEYKKKIEELEKRVAQLENVQTEESLDITDPDILSKYDDSSELSEMLEYINNTHVSLCNIAGDQKSLRRRADVCSDGKIKEFCKDENSPNLYETIDTLYREDGPETIGTFGFWEWKATPNDLQKNFIETRYYRFIEPIEVKFFTKFTGLSSLEDFIAEIYNGLQYDPKNTKVILTISKPDGKCIGLLYSEELFSIDSGILTFSESTAYIPVYEFMNTDILKVRDKYFYKKIILGAPTKLHQIKPMLDVVKTVILESILKVYKKHEFIDQKYETFKKFISTIPEDDIINRIISLSYCNEKTALYWYNQFKEHIEKYINHDSIEDEVVGLAIERNTRLMERAQELVEDKWKGEHEKDIATAQEELKELKDERARLKNKLDNEILEFLQAQEDLEKAQGNLKRAQDELREISDQIDEKKKLAKEVEIEVSNRIARAKEDVAKFIASMAFIGTNSTPNNDAKYDVVDIDLEDQPDQHSNWSDVIETCELELSGAGVNNSKKRTGLSTYLCSAFILKQPLLLVGPNAIDIVEAFSSSLDSGKYGVLDCAGNYSQNLVESIGKENEKIVVIKNFTEIGWVNRLPDILSSKKDIMFIIIYPYAEDIQVEPKSLYNYALPLFTEFFVESSPTRGYCGGYGFLGEESDKKSTHGKPEKDETTLSFINMSMLTRSKIKKVLSIMHKVGKGITEADELMYGALQYAYATMNMPALMDKIQDNEKFADIFKELEDFLGKFNG